MMTLSTISAPAHGVSLNEVRGVKWHTTLELFRHDALSRFSNIVRGAHGRVGRGDDGHSMRTVRGVQLWNGSDAEHEPNSVDTHTRIPNSNLERAVLDLFQEHGLRPRPAKRGVKRNGKSMTSGPHH
jgi:hypothetical protein